MNKHNLDRAKSRPGACKKPIYNLSLVEIAYYGENVTALEKSIKSFQMTRREENMKDLWGSLSNESMPKIPTLIQGVEI